MSKNILSLDFQKQIKNKTYSQLVNYWENLELPLSLEDKFKEFGLTKTSIAETFTKNDPEPIAIYFTQLLIDIIYISEVIIEEDEDELFEFWEQSEFAALFLNLYSNSILETSKGLLKSLEDHFISYFALNYLRNDLPVYNIKTLPEVGDTRNWLFLSDGMAIYLDKHNCSFDDHDFLSLKPKSKLERSKGKEKVILHLTNKLVLRPDAETHSSELEDYEMKINKSLDVLSSLAPDLYDLFFCFTHTIVAIEEPTMVSFSLQSLPGYSSINLSNRDFVDCIDDLIHENGHHYLNFILNSSELITEDPAKDYFSPWRMTQRPIRGIYHGTFTFYWALNLFSKLASSDQLSDHFTEEEVDKIRFRVVEEFYKLRTCKRPLELAKSRDLINERGWELIEQILLLVEEKKEIAVLSESLLTSDSKEKIKEMKKSLEN